MPRVPVRTLGALTLLALLSFSMADEEEAAPRAPVSVHQKLGYQYRSDITVLAPEPFNGATAPSESAENDHDRLRRASSVPSERQLRGSTTGTPLTYYGGPIISSVNVIPVYWSTNVNNIASLNAFYCALATSNTYFKILLQYNTTRYSTNTPLTYGQCGAAYTDSNPSSGSVTEAAVVARLGQLFASGALPTPGPNNYYPIHFPPGLTIVDNTRSASCSTWCAFHNTSTYNGQNLMYGIIPDLSNSGCNRGCGSGTLFQNTCSVASHEFAETVTDPAVGFATNNAPPLAWYNANKGEIGDLCNGQQTTAVLGDGVSYTVQKLYSNAAKACVSSAVPVRTLGALTLLALLSFSMADEEEAAPRTPVSVHQKLGYQYRSDITVLAPEPFNGATAPSETTENDHDRLRRASLVPSERQLRGSTTGTPLTYYGGPIISSVNVIPVYWSTNVNNAASITAFYCALATSNTYFKILLQYNTTRYSTNTPLTYGQCGASYTDSNPSSGSVTEATVLARLNALFTSGALPAPGPNNYYPVHFPPGLTVKDSSGTSSCVTWCAYHGTATYTNSNGQSFNVMYGIIPDLSNSGCNGGCGTRTVLQNTQSVASHEFAETVTDPAVGFATVYGPPLSWYNSAKGEIGDLCNGQQTTAVLGDGVSYTVQKLYSNAAKACVSSA